MAKKSARLTPTYTIGILDSTDKKNLNSDPLMAAIKNGLGTSITVGFEQESVNGRYGKKHAAELDAAAATLVNKGVNLIISIGGVVTARAAARATTGTTLPVVMCVGRIDATDTLLHQTNLTGVNLDICAQNPQRAIILRDRAGISADNVCLMVNSNSAMGKKERDDWDQLGRPFAETGRNGENDQLKLKAAFDYAIENGAEGFIISADPFFMHKRKRILALVEESTLPACYPFKQYVDGGGYVSFGPDLLAAYKTLGEIARDVLPGGALPAVVTPVPVQFPP